MSMTDVEQALIQVREVLINAPKNYQHLTDSLRILENERQDVLHAMEFGKADAIARQYLYGVYEEVSNRRRKVKNELEILEEVKALAERGKWNEHQVNTTLGKVRKIKMSQEVRTYGMRVRKDLQHYIK